MIQKLEKKQSENERLIMKYEQDKKELDNEKNSFKPKYNIQPIEKIEYSTAFTSFDQKKEELNEKINDLENENDFISLKKNRIIEEFELKMIEMDKESHPEKKRESIMSIIDMKQYKKKLTKKRMEKEFDILRSMEINVEWLTKIPFWK